MAKFQAKSAVVEAVTFDELVAHGIAVGAGCENGMPWSFDYQGHPITHENDNCYLILTPKGIMHFTRDDVLITSVSGAIYPCKSEIFRAVFDAVE